ncbi:MAG: L-threonylcarbamoyladenylate synthase [Desulfobulbaceae bacterium]|nr:L-threonylcarbamoyladenylate synthase [Desulfobulbaceae bacterium]
MKPLSAPPEIAVADLAAAVQVLRQGGVVAFPTETYYGLAADPFNPAALARLFRLKQRPLAKAILVLIRDRGQLPLLASGVPAPFQPLMARFWPGPLTLVFPAVPTLPRLLTGGSGTVAVRLSSHPLAGRLLAAFGGPLTATSANLSGQPAAASAHQVRAQFGPAVDCILDGGLTPGGKGTTLVGYDNHHLFLLRDGVIPFAEIVDPGATLPF